MINSWNNIVEDVQEYLTHGIAILPNITEMFLEALSIQEHQHKLCMLPYARLELYHIRLYRKMIGKLALKKAA
jgi:hypothetical protein